MVLWEKDVWTSACTFLLKIFIRSTGCLHFITSSSLCLAVCIFPFCFLSNGLSLPWGEIARDDATEDRFKVSKGFSCHENNTKMIKLFPRLSWYIYFVKARWLLCAWTGSGVVLSHMHKLSLLLILFFIGFVPLLPAIAWCRHENHIYFFFILVQIVTIIP